ncbi:Scarecrow-like protein 9 [Nymphaea thermarum]|nr:Scarecrow-like protein 9 [Nymphaea thermarum]
MDPLEDLSIFMNGFKVEETFQDVPLILPDPPPSNFPAPPSTDASSVPPTDSEPPDDCELLSDVLLNYIREMLMDENVEEQSYVYEENSALQAAEKPFYDILGEKYPPSHDHHPLYQGDGPESPDDGSCLTGDATHSHQAGSHISGSSSSGSDSNWTPDHVAYPHPNELVSPVSTLSINYSGKSSFNSPLGSRLDEVEGCRETLVENFRLPDFFDESHVWQFRKGMEEASKFLPNGNISFNLQMNGLPPDSKLEVKEVLPNGNFVIDTENNVSVQDSKTGKQFTSNRTLMVNPNCSRQELEKDVTKCLPNGNAMVNLENSALPRAAKLEANNFLPNGSVVLNQEDNASPRVSKQEAINFLPNGSLLLNLEKQEAVHDLKLGINNINIKVEKRDERESLMVKSTDSNDQNGFRGHKNPHSEDAELEVGRSNKHSAISFSSDTVRSEMFDQVLLCRKGKCVELVTNLREAMQNSLGKNVQNGHSKGSSGTKSRGKRQGKREVVDLRALLIHCAQAVATDDLRSANELLRQIRQHSSPYGDGTQRLAHCFAESLEARLSGTGGNIYYNLKTKRNSAASILKAHQLYLAACPFKRISHYLSNQTTLNVAENATKLHIIDFGILYGFQWPSFIQRLSARPGGPPRLRITGIDFPQPGFKPAERIEETGCRLSEYARMFNVPFQYKAIASKWENVEIEDLDLDDGEVLVVNCLYRMRNLPDETVFVDCPRDIVLNKIRKMNPKVFILGIINGAYSAPFFTTRFREALFQYSAFFDMLETNTPRDHPERILIEREIFGREVLNIVACEGSDRIERPEVYKQWQVRNQRAGFVQLPLNQDIMQKSREKVKHIYHKDFMVDEDSQWLLQGWKGRILQALSTWVPSKNHHDY